MRTHTRIPAAAGDDAMRVRGQSWCSRRSGGAARRGRETCTRSQARGSRGADWSRRWPAHPGTYRNWIRDGPLLQSMREAPGIYLGSVIIAQSWQDQGNTTQTSVAVQGVFIAKWRQSVTSIMQKQCLRSVVLSPPPPTCNSIPLTGTHMPARLPIIHIHTHGGRCAP